MTWTALEEIQNEVMSVQLQEPRQEFCANY
jgi:hypothetical protein